MTKRGAPRGGFLMGKSVASTEQGLQRGKRRQGIQPQLAIPCVKGETSREMEMLSMFNQFRICAFLISPAELPSPASFRNETRHYQGNELLHLPKSAFCRVVHETFADVTRFVDIKYNVFSLFPSKVAWWACKPNYKTTM